MSMGAIWFTGASLVGLIAEVAGFKTGLALSRPELRKIITSRPELKTYWPRSFEQSIRIRSEVYEGLIAWVLFKLGNIETPSTESFSMRLLRRYTKAGLGEP